VEQGGTVRAGDYILSMEKETEIINWEHDFFVHYRIVSAVKRVGFVSDRMSCVVLRGCWCIMIVLNVHAPGEEKSDDSKDSFDEELEQVFNHIPKYHMKNLLGDFNTKLCIKPIIVNESLHQDRKDNAIRIVNFTTSIKKAH